MPSDTPYVAVIGGANIDIHGRSSAPLIDHDSNPGEVQVAAGGVARNIAENLARLGVDTRLITAIGNDEHGRMLLQSCRDAGVDTNCVQVIESAPTSTYLSVLDDRGEMQVAVSDMGIVEQLNAARLRTIQDILERASLIIIDTNLPDAALAWLAENFSGQPLFVDTVSATKAPRIRPYLAAVHTLKTSQIEAEALAGLQAATEVQLAEIAEWFHSWGVERVFITLGSQGVFYSAGGSQGICQHGTGEPEIRNTGGAGDAFLAGLAHAWLEDWPAEDSLQFALAAAAVTLVHPGTNNPELSLETITARQESLRD